MVTFHEGPADGKNLELRRAPKFLRVVIDRGHVDALDQLDDEPTAEERIVVYVLRGEVTRYHACGRDKHGKRFGRWGVSADYWYFEEQPADAEARTREAWEAWAINQARRLQKQDSGVAS